ncbi:MAG TPA: hypothetical protein VND64_04555 [Pirellulales bacterium]|nr:hypothetical protein [Pirellulales bacterium]
MSVVSPFLVSPHLLANAPLLAAIDLGDILKVIFVIVFISIGAIKQLGKAADAQKRKMARPPAPPRPPRPQPGRREVEDEVSDFLRRAAEKRAGRPAVVTPADAPVEPTRRLIEIGASDVIHAQAIEEPPTGASVAQHVRQHLDTREFEARASNLTSVDQADEAIESHLHQVFAHQVGHLSSSRPADPVLEGQSGAAPTTPDTTAPAEYLVSLLGNPQSLRSAVILREVLERPTQRWS